MKSKEFIDKLYNVLNYKTLYVMGCFGAPLNPNNKIRYTKNHTYNINPVRGNMIVAASHDTFGFDCVNLIKGILWGWSGDLTKSYGGAIYSSNGVPDVGADQMIKLCESTTDFKKIQPGWVVWMSGHIGVYVGEGKVIECTPKWKNGCQITLLANNGYTQGNSRIWKLCGPLPYIDYTEEEVIMEKRYNTLEEIPNYGKEAIEYFMKNGTLNGTKKGLQLSEDMIRILTIFYKNLRGENHGN